MKRLSAALAGVAALAVALSLWRWRAPASTGAPTAGAGGGSLGPAAPSRPLAAAGATALGAPRGRGSAVLAGRWGSGPGEFGRRRDPESNPEGPMALVAGRAGELAVLDQVNRRVQRTHDGRLTGVISLGGDTVQDLALGPEGRTVLLDRLADASVQVYGPDGSLIGEAPLAGKGLGEGGEATGVFADESGIYVERRHEIVVRVADVNGNADAERPELLGRPSRDGRFLLQAEVASRQAGEVLVRATDRSQGGLAWAQRVAAGAPLFYLVMLDSDAHGNTVVALDVGHETAGQGPTDEHLVAIRLGPGGAARGALELPALAQADETFRPLSLDDDGALYMLVPTESGLSVVRYTF